MILHTYMKVDECKQMENKIQHSLETNFRNLPTGNRITQGQANKIKAVINKTKVTQESNLMDSNEINYINSLKSIVDSGSITKDQAEKIIMMQIHLCQVKWSTMYCENL